MFSNAFCGPVSVKDLHPIVPFISIRHPSSVDSGGGGCGKQPIRGRVYLDVFNSTETIFLQRTLIQYE